MDTVATKRIGVALGLLVIVAVLTVLAWAILREEGPQPIPAGADNTADTGADGGPDEDCETPIIIQVTTTEDFAPVVEAAADRVEGDESCASYEVTTASSAVAAEQIRTGTNLPNVWISDSDVWVERVNQDPGAPTLTAGPALATSPAVLAVPNSLAESTGMSGPHPWQAILTGELEVRIGDPEESTTSLLLLHAAQEALGGTPQGEQLLGAEMIRMSRQSAAESELLAQASADGEDATAVAATEQQVFRQRAENPDAPLEAVVPAEGTGALTYSWVPIPHPEQDADTRRAVSELQQSLTGPAGEIDRQETGFRLPDGGEGLGVPGVAEPVTTVPEPSVAAVEAMVTTWNTVAVDMRMLAVIDVSGSMLQPVGDQTRIELATASAQTAMTVFPPTSQVGLWVFSTDHPSGNDWTELAPIVQLDAEYGDGTHRDALLAAAATLPRYPRDGDDTGLYDTVLAAYRAVQDNYEPGYVNSVVLLTDGVNENDDGISLSELLAALQASVDPSKPIPVITVGMGTGTDEEVLRLIAAQTGGRSYLARDPADISTVFVDALTHRPG